MKSHAYAALTLAISLLAGCAASTTSDQLSGRKIIGPKGYTVDWDIPETGAYWIPKGSVQEIKAASKSCKALFDIFVDHHTPLPPQYSYIGFRFKAETDDAARSCVIAKLQAVPALTIYPKKRYRLR